MGSIFQEGGYLQLRRIQPQKIHGAPDVYCQKPQNLLCLTEVTKFGRNPEMVNVVLSNDIIEDPNRRPPPPPPAAQSILGGNQETSNMISRTHAEIRGYRNPATGRFDKYTVSDHSLNGTYINDMRISGTDHPLAVGDVIKFGHLNGAAVRPGFSAPQANAEFAFLVEHATEKQYMGVDAQGRRTTILGIRAHDPTMMELGPNGVPVGTTPTATTTPSAVPGTSFAAWPANSFAYTGAAAQNFAFPPFNFGGLNNPAIHANLMQMLSARNQQLQMDPQWAAAMMQQQLTPAQIQAAQNAIKSGVYTSVAASVAHNTNPATSLALGAIQPNGTALFQQLFQQQALHPTVLQQTGHPAANAPTPGATSSTPTAIAEAAAVKSAVGSPPMECDSSVPSPPKPTTRPAAALSPKNSDRGSEKSWTMVDSPPMPRAPAPSHANRELSRTPPPKPDTPEDVKREREEEERRKRKEEREREEREEKEKEEERRRKREKEEKEAKERRTTVAPAKKGPKGVRKGSELGRLLHDLEGSFMTSARGSDLREQRKSIDGLRKDSEEPREEKPRKKEPSQAKDERPKEKEKKKEKPARVGASTSSAPPEKPAPPPAAPALKPTASKLRQLSDVSSVSSSDSEDDVKRKKAKKKSPIPKKEAKKRQPSPPSASSDSETDSLSSLDETIAKAKMAVSQPPPRKAAYPPPKKTQPPPKKRGRKPTKSRGDSSEAPSDSDDADEPMFPPKDPSVTYHDPVAACGMDKECNRPQTLEVNWVCCDDCDKWYHAICILGKEDITGLGDFTCGCKEAKTKPKKKKMR